MAVSDVSPQAFSKLVRQSSLDDCFQTESILIFADSGSKTEPAVVQTVAVLLENGPAFSVLFANRILYSKLEEMVYLEECTQFRIEPDGRRFVRKFPRVSIYRDPDFPYYVATPDNGKTIFSQPSRDSYVVLELDEKDSEEIYRAFKKSDLDLIFERLRVRYGSLPGFFTPDVDELRAPDTYACAADQYPADQSFL